MAWQITSPHRQVTIPEIIPRRLNIGIHEHTAIRWTMENVRRRKVASHRPLIRRRGATQMSEGISPGLPAIVSGATVAREKFLILGIEIERDANLALVAHALGQLGARPGFIERRQDERG